MSSTVVVISIAVRGHQVITAETSQQAAETFVADWHDAIHTKTGHRGVVAIEEADGDLIAVPSTDVLSVIVTPRKAET